MFQTFLPFVSKLSNSTSIFWSHSTFPNMYLSDSAQVTTFHNHVKITFFTSKFVTCTWLKWIGPNSLQPKTNKKSYKKVLWDLYHHVSKKTNRQPIRNYDKWLCFSYGLTNQKTCQ